MEGQIKGFPDKVKLKEFIITKPLLYEMLRELSKKKKIKNMKSKMTTNSQLLTTKPKNNNNNNKNLSKQLEQEQNHRNGDHMEGYQWRVGGARMREKVRE